MKLKHLELLKLGDSFFIQINSLVGRISLFADHPKFKFKEAIDLKNILYKTTGKLSLIKLAQKDLYILEDKDSNGNSDQNFIFVSEELSEMMEINPSGAWLKKHIIDFFSRSLSVLFLTIFLAYYFLVMRYYNSTQILFALDYITGVLTLVFAVSYYLLRASKSKSSFLRFCFKMELIIFIIAGTLNNIYYLVNLNSATDIF